MKTGLKLFKNHNKQTNTNQPTSDKLAWS